MKRSNEVDKYVVGAPSEFVPLLEETRRYIFDILTDVPEMTEVYSYKIAVYKYGKKPLFSIAYFKDHCSLITQDKEIEKKFSKELAEYRISGTSIHFSPEKPIPKELLEKIIQMRLESRGM